MRNAYKSFIGKPDHTEDLGAGWRITLE